MIAYRHVKDLAAISHHATAVCGSGELRGDDEKAEGAA